MGHSGNGASVFLALDHLPERPELALSVKALLAGLDHHTRFHTGAWLDADALGDAIAQEDYRGDERDPSAVAPVRLPASVLPLGLSPAEQREAMRALRGRALRQEVYALSLQEDGNAVLERPQPYRVVEGNATVRLVQPRAGQRHAVFFVHEREALEQHYERDASDPRLSHRVILAVDDFGSVTRSAAISYRRRLPAVAGADQSRTRIVYGEHDVVNLVDAGDALRIGVPISSRSFEVTGVPDGDPVLSFEVVDAQTQAAGEVDFEARDAPGLLRRRLQSTRQLYWADDLAGPLPFGEVGTHALPHEERRMVATRARIAEVFAGLLPEAGDGAGVLDVEGGYVAEGGAWWSRSGYQVFDPAAFFLPAAAVDAFGNTYAIAYDTHHLAVVSVSDPRGNVTTATHDYRVLQPASVMDANGNRAQAMFDALGLVTATVRMGKAGDEDGDSSAAPTVRITYDLHAFAERGAPASSRTLQREQYGSVDADARVLESWTHYDGTGRVVQTKAQAEPGQAPVHDVDGVLVRDETGAPLLAPTTTRWVGSGRTVVDNKGNPIKQYEPFFSDRPDYDGEDELSRTGVTPLLHYDPFGRLVRTDFPDGTAARVEITSWSTTSFDRNDTVLESAWLLARGPGASASERRAAQLASAHANTPAVSHFDVLGRGVLVEAQVVVDGALQVLRTQTELDIEGNAVRVIDARGNVAESRIHAMGGVLLMVESADAGWRRALVDVAGAPLRSWNARGFASRAGYDALRRGTHAFVTPPGGVEMLVTRTVWGEAVATAVADNLRGRVFRVYDGAGEHTNVRHDFAGNLLQQSVRLNRAFEGTQDWSALGASDGASDPDAIAALADASLEAGSFVATMQYDALGRVVSRTTPDGSETRTRFNEAGLLEAADVRVRGAAEASAIVVEVDYDARGQRLRCVHGNGTTASYAYEPDTFRLSRMRLVRSSDDAVLQDLRYTYDPVGNIVEIRDGAQQRVYFDNDVVGADQRFEYDALYRLSFASGRELRSLSQSIDADLAFGPQPHADDPAALRTYEETYAWDAVGNIVELRHVAAGGNFTRRYAYATGGNRLLRNSAPGEAAEPFSHSYAYDEHGNMTGMPHLAAMAWDHADRLQHCDLGGGGEVWFVYDASGARVRKVQRNASGSRVRERVYLGEFELYRERAANDVAPTLERETLHVGDGARRLCLVETLTVEDGERVAAPVSVPRFQHGNHLDSAALELDGEAAVISYEEFHPFGTTSYAANDAAVEVSPKRYRYISKERDEETGLYHLGARYYASWLGRWTAADPIGLADGVNRYAYCRGNPVGFRDTTGSARESVAGALVLHQNELVEAMNGAESPSTADALRAELATVTGELVHELVDLARRQEARDQLRRLDVSARIQAGASEATHGSMSTGTPTDAIDRAFDPRELQRAELAQMSSLGFIANGAFQKASVVLEEAGLIAPMSDQERRVRGLSAGDMLDNLSAFSGNGTRPMSGRTPAPSRAPLKNRSGTIDDASRTRRTHPAAAESRGSQAAERPVAARGAGRAAPELSTAAQRSIRSLEGRLAEHESKLVAYRENPFAFDNRGDLARNAARPEVQQRIIDGRIRHLEGEIRNFQQQLERLRSGSVEP